MKREILLSLMTAVIPAEVEEVVQKYTVYKSRDGIRWLNTSTSILSGKEPEFDQPVCSCSTTVVSTVAVVRGCATSTGSQVESPSRRTAD